MKRSKEYKQMLKKYKKLIMKSAREATKSPWEAMFGLDMFINFMNFMKDYYTLGENVWQVDESKQEVIDTLTQTLNEYDAWQNCEDKYTKVLLKTNENFEKERKHFLRLGYHEQPCNDERLFKDVVFLTLYEDYKENNTQMIKEYVEHRDNFFKLISNNISKWWD